MRTARPHVNLPRRAAAVALAAGIGAIAVPTAVASADAPSRRELPLSEVGVGTATADPCLDREGRCGFVLKGTLDGDPADETFFSVIDDDGKARDDDCVPARYAGLFGDGPDQSIGHVSDGKLCPDGAGGYVFTGRYRIKGGLGPFEGAHGRGRLVALLPADGTTSVTATGYYTLPR